MKNGITVPSSFVTKKSRCYLELNIDSKTTNVIKSLVAQF